MHRKKHCVYSVQYYPQFQASPGGAGIYPPRTRETTVLLLSTFIDEENEPQRCETICLSLFIQRIADLECEFTSSSSLSSNSNQYATQPPLLMWSPAQTRWAWALPRVARKKSMRTRNPPLSLLPLFLWCSFHKVQSLFFIPVFKIFFQFSLLNEAFTLTRAPSDYLPFSFSTISIENSHSFFGL